MGAFNAVDGDELRNWLEHVQKRETAAWLMAAIAHDEGVSISELADWYGFEADELADWFDELETEPLVVAIAEREGVDFAAIAGKSGLGRRTIVDWFEALDRRPVAEAADIIHRYSQQRVGPLLSTVDSRVHYLDHEALQRQGWSLDDEDLFEKASAAGLDADSYGRFLVKSGETILEAAENRGIDWPYACRGGACANCAVIVREGDIAMPGQTILSDDQVQRANARLTCVGVPVSPDVKLVMNVQHLDQFRDLRLPSPMTESRPAV